MLYLLTNSSKPIGEMTWQDVCMRKVSNEHAAFFVAKTEEEAKRLAVKVFGERGESISGRAFTKEELQVLQMQCSTQLWCDGKTVKFIFETVDETTGATYHHKSVHTVEEKGPIG
jgi:hypothetical protein